MKLQMYFVTGSIFICICKKQQNDCYENKQSVGAIMVEAPGIRYFQNLDSWNILRQCLKTHVSLCQCVRKQMNIGAINRKTTVNNNCIYTMEKNKKNLGNSQPASKQKKNRSHQHQKVLRSINTPFESINKIIVYTYSLIRKREQLFANGLLLLISYNFYLPAITDSLFQTVVQQKDR